MFFDEPEDDSPDEKDAGNKKDTQPAAPFQDELAAHRAATATGSATGGRDKNPDTSSNTDKTKETKFANNVGDKTKIDLDDPISEAAKQTPEEIVFDSEHPQFQKLEPGKVYRVSMRDQGRSRTVVIYVPTTYNGKTTSIAGMDGLALKNFNQKGWLANKWDVLAEKTGAALVVPENLPFYESSHPIYKILGTHLVDWNYWQGKGTKSAAEAKDPFAAFAAPGQRTVTKPREGPNDPIFMRNLLEHLRQNTNIFVGERGARFVCFSSGGTLPRAILKNPETSGLVDSMVTICSTDYYPNKPSPTTRPIEDLRPGARDVPELTFFGHNDQLVPPKDGDGPKTKPLRPFGHTNLSKYSEPKTAVVVRALRNGGTGTFEIIERQTGHETRQYHTRPEAPVIQVDVAEGQHRVFGRREIESAYSHNNPKIEGEPDITSKTLEFWQTIEAERLDARLAEATRKGNVDELVKIASTAEDPRLAIAATSSIAKIAPNNLPTILRDLANSRSPAAFMAMCHLAWHSEAPADKRATIDFINSGKMAEFHRAGQLKTIDLIAVALPILKDESSVDQFMKALDPYPDLKIKICQDLPAASRGLRHKQLPESLSVRSVEYLIEKKPLNYENTLHAYAISPKSNPRTAQISRDHLQGVWTSQKQSSNGQPRINRLLVSDHLQKFVQQRRSESYPDNSDPKQAYAEWVEQSRNVLRARNDSMPSIRAQIATKQNLGRQNKQIDKFIADNWHNNPIIEPLLQNGNGLVEAYRHIRQLEKIASETRQALEPLITQRKARAIEIISGLAAQVELHCPAVSFTPDTKYIDPFNVNEEVNKTGKRLGTYRQGDLELREGLIMQGQCPTAELLDAAGHELGHHDEEDLMLRHEIDETEIELEKESGAKVTIGTIIDETTRNKLKAVHAKQRGGEILRDTFLDAVLLDRNGKRLNDQERITAKALIDAAQKQIKSFAVREVIEKQIVDLQAINKRIVSGEPLSDILKTAKSEEYRLRLERLLDVKELPDYLSKAISRLVKAEKNKSGEIDQIRLDASGAFQKAIGERNLELQNESRAVYLNNQIEDNPGKIDQRINFFARLHNEERENARLEARFVEASKQRNVDELVKIASIAENSRLAKRAMNSIIALAPNNLSDILRDLAKSDSPAAFDAMCNLAMNSEEAADRRMVLDFVQNGKMSDFQRNGQIDLATLIPIVYTTLPDRSSIDEFMKALDPYPDLKNEICEVLPAYLLPDQAYYDKQKSEDLAMASIEYLIEKQPAKHEEALYTYAMSKEHSPSVVQKARDALEKTLTTQEPSPRGKVSANPLLDSERLRQFVQIFAEQPWADGQDLTERYAEWLETFDEAIELRDEFLESIDAHVMERLNKGPQQITSKEAAEYVDTHWVNQVIMEPLLQDKPELLETYRYMRNVENESDRLRKPLNEILEKRFDSVVKTTQTVTAKLGLRCPKIILVPATFDDHAEKEAIGIGAEAGVHSPGEISISEGLLIGGLRPARELKRTIGHELGHELDSECMLRYFIDELEFERNIKITKEADSAIRQELQSRYLARSGENFCPEAFLVSVIAHRNGNRQTTEEQLRAKMLMQANVEHANWSERLEVLEKQVADLLSIKERMAAREPPNKVFTPTRIRNIPTSSDQSTDAASAQITAKPEEYGAYLTELLNLKTLPEALSQSMTKLAQAEKSGSRELPKIQAQTYKLLAETIGFRIADLKKEMAKEYLDNTEKEKHEIDRRIAFFDELHQSRQAVSTSRVEANIADRSIVLDAKSTNVEEHHRNALGQCKQHNTPDCNVVAGLNCFTTDLNKSKFLSDAVQQVGPKDYLVRLYSKWDIDNDRNQEPVTIKVNIDELKQMHADMARQDIKVMGGPLFAQIIDLAILKHMRQNVPAQYARTGKQSSASWLYAISGERYTERSIGPQLTLLSESALIFQLLTGAKPIHSCLETFSPDGLDGLAAQMDNVVINTKFHNAQVSDIEGKKLELYSGHYYSLLNVDSTKRAVTILNPHAGAKPQTLSYDTFLNTFYELSAYPLPEDLSARNISVKPRAEAEIARELNMAAAETQDTKPSETTRITLANDGIVNIGAEHQIALASIWNERIKHLESEHARLSEDPANAKQVEEINRQLEIERTMLASLDPSHPRHTQALKEASQLINEAKERMHAPDIHAAQAGEHVRSLSEFGAEQRGRLTAFTMLLKDIVAKLIGH